MNHYIDKIVPLGTEDKLYNCECRISGDSHSLGNWVGFWLSGGQVRKLWRGLEHGSHDYNIEFRFGHSKDIALSVFCNNPNRVNYYMRFLDAPELFNSLVEA